MLCYESKQAGWKQPRQDQFHISTAALFFSPVPPYSARNFACCYMEDALLLIIISLEYKCSTFQHILQNGTSVILVKWLWAQELLSMVCRCFVPAVQMEQPGNQGLAALGVTKMLREGGWPDAESSAGRRNGVLRGALVTVTGHGRARSRQSAQSTNLAPIVLKIWLTWEEFWVCPKFLGADVGPIIYSSGFQQSTGLAPDGDNALSW